MLSCGLSPSKTYLVCPRHQHPRARRRLCPRSASTNNIAGVALAALSAATGAAVAAPASAAAAEPGAPPPAQLGSPRRSPQAQASAFAPGRPGSLPVGGVSPINAAREVSPLRPSGAPPHAASALLRHVLGDRTEQAAAQQAAAQQAAAQRAAAQRADDTPGASGDTERGGGAEEEQRSSPAASLSGLSAARGTGGSSSFSVVRCAAA